MTNFTNYFSKKSTTLSANWTAIQLGITWQGDLNGDGYDDLIVTGASYPSNGNIAQSGKVMFGDGKGNFTSATENIFPSSTLQTVHPRKILVGDFNGDGRPDIFIASHGYDTSPFSGEQNKLYLSQSNGTWKDATSTLPQLLDFSHGASIGDINGDGSVDIYVNNVFGQAAQNPYILKNNGLGIFSIANGALPNGSGQLLDVFHLPLNQFTSSYIDDLNNDGKKDLILGTEGTRGSANGSLILWNQGSGFDQNNVTFLPTGHQTGNSFTTIDIATLDVNNDGLKDILCLSSQTNPYYQGTFIDVYTNKGDKTFENQTDKVIGATASHFTGGWSQFLTVKDINNDGLQDIIMCQYSGQKPDSDSIALLLNKGNGTFLTVTFADLASNIDSIAFGAASIKTDNGISFVSPYSYNGGLGANELISTKALPKFAYGTATADLQGARKQYTVTNASNVITVSDSVTNRDGSQILLDIQQRVKFTDGVLAFDVANTADNSLVYRIYQAAFARSPDEGGFRFWVGQHSNGLNFNTMATEFINSGEFKNKYGSNSTNAQLVDLAYQNVLGRQGESGGVTFWNNELNTGHQTKEQVLIGFAASAENVAKTAANIDNGYWLI